MKALGVIAISFLIAGCESIGINKGKLPSTLGENSSGYGYIPLDGLAVDQTLEADSCKAWRQLTDTKSVLHSRRKGWRRSL